MTSPSPLQRLERYDVDSDRALRNIPVMYECADGIWTPYEVVEKNNLAIVERLKEIHKILDNNSCQELVELIAELESERKEE